MAAPKRVPRRWRAFAPRLPQAAGARAAAILRRYRRRPWGARAAELAYPAREHAVPAFRRPPPPPRGRTEPTQIRLAVTFLVPQARGTAKSAPAAMQARLARVEAAPETRSPARTGRRAGLSVLIAKVASAARRPAFAGAAQARPGSAARPAAQQAAAAIKTILASYRPSPSAKPSSATPAAQRRNVLARPAALVLARKEERSPTGTGTSAPRGKAASSPSSRPPAPGIVLLLPRPERAATASAKAAAPDLLVAARRPRPLMPAAPQSLVHRPHAPDAAPQPLASHVPPGRERAEARRPGLDPVEVKVALDRLPGSAMAPLADKLFVHFQRHMRRLRERKGP